MLQSSLRVLKYSQSLSCVRCALAVVNLLTVALRLTFRTVTFLVANCLFLFQLHNLVVELRLVQKVGVARKDGHELGKIHACVLVHTVLVYAAHGYRAVVDLVDEKAACCARG